MRRAAVRVFSSALNCPRVRLVESENKLEVNTTILFGNPTLATYYVRFRYSVELTISSGILYFPNARCAILSTPSIPEHVQGSGEASANSFAEQHDTHRVKNAVTLHRPNCLKMAQRWLRDVSLHSGATPIPHCTDSLELE